MSKITQAMVMAAGFGKRMLPLTKTIHKSMIEVNGKSLIENILINLYKSKIYKIVINTHYLAETLKAHVVSLDVYSKLDITFLYEEKILDSGGGVVNALSYLEAKPFYRINSDIFWKSDELETLEQNWEDNFDALLGVLPKEQLIGYNGIGDFDLISNKFIKINKNRDYVFAGIGIFSPKLFKEAKNEEFTLFGDYIFKQRLSENNILDNIYGIDLKTEIYHVDNPTNLELVKNIFKSRL